jgi:hypothetical protein
MRRMRRWRTLSVVIAAACFGALAATPARADDRAASADTTVRSAPFDVAPEIALLHAGDRVCADDQPQGAWRRVGLADGRHGFVREADTQVVPSDPNHPCTAASPPPVVAVGNADVGALSTQSSTAPLRSAKPAREPAERHLLGVMFELLPVGTVTFEPPSADGGDTLYADSLFAVAVAPFFDAAVSPYIAFGVSPQAIFRVKSDQTSEKSAKQFDFRFRLTGRLPLSPRVRAFARVSPAYSVIQLPPLPPRTTGSRSNPQGFLINVAVGLEVAVLPNLFIVTDLGYQAGFQGSAGGDTRTSYLHLGAGFAIGL